MDAPVYSIGPRRVYAIGDPHGRDDLFARLISLIREDNAGRSSAPTEVIVLGDVVDRGPQSAQLVRRLMRYTQGSDRFTVLKGNHEDMLERVIQVGFKGMERWLDMGGAETLASWDVPSDLIAARDYADILRVARASIPQEVVHWLHALPSHLQLGDVVFVHAGIRPGVPLKRQDPGDLMWIGSEFREDARRHPFLVVHGHAIREDGPDIQLHRIGIDTGAYRTGRLTAMGLEGAESWFLST